MASGGRPKFGRTVPAIARSSATSDERRPGRRADGGEGRVDGMGPDGEGHRSAGWHSIVMSSCDAGTPGQRRCLRGWHQARRVRWVSRPPFPEPSADHRWASTGSRSFRARGPAGWPRSWARKIRDNECHPPFEGQGWRHRRSGRPHVLDGHPGHALLLLRRAIVWGSISYLVKISLFALVIRNRYSCP